MVQGIKSVFVGLTEEGDEKPVSALSYGLSLAQSATAHLTLQAAAVQFKAPYSLLSGLASELVGAENRRIAALASVVANRGKGIADLAGVNYSSETPHLTYDRLVVAFLRHARVHDLSVLGMEADPVAIDRGLTNAVLFESGRPVVIVPTGCETFRCRRVVIAWDGGGAAARAVADALPFLRSAEAVEICAVVGEKDLARSVPGADLAPHLARHGANVTVNTLTARNGDVAETLRERARLFDADLLVMGAFKHARLRELLLGGVTQSILRHCPLPVLMSH